jgi:enoyl-acyl-carrier-protein reductase
MTGTAALMAGKKGLIMGLANDKSIAWGIAQALNAQGAHLEPDLKFGYAYLQATKEAIEETRRRDNDKL